MGGRQGGSMGIAYTAEERKALNATAQDILDAHPDVGSFIRRGLARDPEAETLVYLRTALDPAPVVTRAREFHGLLNSATRWLRRHGVGPGDVVSLLAPNCTRDLRRLLGGDELRRRAAAQSPLHPRSDRRAGERGESKNPVRAAAGCAGRPL